ncbi:hypothetical protein ABZ468_49240 [Streptomyces sp. NPDC005708]|uniref:hypothetical protein n=1 Tax=Streptomyces sp. NPDC005708 TaxID=3154564 RepID=UPI0033F3A83A
MFEISQGAERTSGGGALERALSIPYMLDVSTRESESGEWVCRLEYPELDGCVAESRDALDAHEQLEMLREQWLRHRVETHQEVPAPRPSLRS